MKADALADADEALRAGAGVAAGSLLPGLLGADGPRTYFRPSRTTPTSAGPAVRCSRGGCSRSPMARSDLEDGGAIGTLRRERGAKVRLPARQSGGTTG